MGFARLVRDNFHHPRCRSIVAILDDSLAEVVA
jgi:hypothetical protein